MGKKHTYEFIKQSFENDGYELLSKEYINAQIKLNYQCSNGHKHNITWGHWKGGQRCPYCSNNNIKFTLDYIKKCFNKDGYILFSKEYIDCNTKLYYKCSNGHERSITFNNWRMGQRCSICYGKIKLTLENIRKSFIKSGYELLSKEYIDAHTKLDCKCPNGHIHSISWSNWQQGRRCPTCKNIQFSGLGHPNWKGGISFEPYCPIWKDKEYKNYIKERDNYKCLNPACTKKYSVLTIHHIDYNKKNCSPSNLITVCRSCNGIANFDREWHTAWYKALLYRRYKLC